MLPKRLHDRRCVAERAVVRITGSTILRRTTSAGASRYACTAPPAISRSTSALWARTRRPRERKRRTQRATRYAAVGAHRTRLCSAGRALNFDAIVVGGGLVGSAVG